MLHNSAIPTRIVSVVLMGVLGFPSAGIGEDWDVIIVSGQSNAVGYDADAERLPKDAVDERIPFWWRCGDPPPDDFDSVGPRKWTTLQPQPRGNPNPDKSVPRQYGNFSRPSGGFGPEIGMARSLGQDEGRRIAVLKVAFSGTSLLNDWNPRDPGPTGACYRALIEEYRLAAAAAKEQGDILRPRAFVWVQGESDANPEGAKRYPDAMLEMVAALRQAVETPDLKVLIGVNTRFGSLEKVTEKMQLVIDAQRAAAERDPLVVYVDCDGVTLANTAHFDTEGTLVVGRRFADAFRKLEAGGEKPRQ